METKKSYFEWKGYLVALLTFVYSLFFFYWHSSSLYYSVMGAIVLMLLAWLSYLVLRFLYITYTNLSQ